MGSEVTDRLGGPFIPLQGPEGMVPKAPAVSGWASPGYEGIDPTLGEHWLGLRCDGLVVIDCDSVDAAQAWTSRCGVEGKRTYVRKTPRGFHFIYSWVQGAPTGPAVGVFDGVDIRAGNGSQIVYYAPGYSDVGSSWADVKPFDPAWLPERKSTLAAGDGWEEMPAGRGNVTMTAIAGALRKQGLAERPIRVILAGVNKLTMTESPMSPDEIALIARSVCRYEPNPDLEFVVDDDED